MQAGVQNQKRKACRGKEKAKEKARERRCMLLHACHTSERHEKQQKAKQKESQCVREKEAVCVCKLKRELKRGERKRKNPWQCSVQPIPPVCVR